MAQASQELPTSDQFFKATKATTGHFDELNQGEGAGAWTQFFEQLPGAGPKSGDFARGLTQRSQQVARDVAAHGITYNVYADSNGPRRPWALDTLPVLLSTDDWAKIESGVLQRTRLLNAVLADIYGEQRLLRDGMIPSALVHGHSGYLRPVHGIKPLGGTWLHVAAFDLARSPQGQWQLVSQRTQAPSGLGYLLENRQIIGRQFPDAFQKLRVQRLADTYAAIIDGLVKHCPPLEPGEVPRIALLTPGPYNETHFEHAYLASSLGLTLVEGSDLVVRGDRLYLRTLDGLQRVHVLMKRLDDEYLDPLELRADSALGIAGLVQVVRSGQVVLANMPGTGVVESPALLGFLPAIAQKLLGETLSLPALDTWWCGEAAAMADALPQLAQLVIKPTASHGPPSVIARQLPRRALDELTGRIVRRGTDTTLQRWMPLAQTPTFLGATAGTSPKLVPRSYLLRVFVVCDGTTDGVPRWRVLPGGLARIASAAQADVVSMQYGGSSADVWVMGEPSRAPTLVQKQSQGQSQSQSQGQSQGQSQNQSPSQFQDQARPTAITPTRLEGIGHTITSRAAENLYWFGRYTERCEHTARLARVALSSLNSEDPPSQALGKWLHATAAQAGLIASDAPQPNADPAGFELALVDGLASKTQCSVGYNLRALRGAADAVRERLSGEHWQLIQRAGVKFFAALSPAKPADGVSAQTALRAIDELIEDIAAMTGAQTDRMTRDNGWRCLSVGRQLERLHQLSNAFLIGLRESAYLENDGFDALLNLFDSTITYRARFSMRRDLGALTELLVRDSDNPRALAWVASQLRGRLSKLANAAPLEKSELALTVTDPSTWEANAPVDVLIASLEPLSNELFGLSDGLSAQYFRHLNTSRQHLAQTQGLAP